MRGNRALGGVAIAILLALAFWLLFIRTPDGAKTSSAAARNRALTPSFLPEAPSTSTSEPDATPASEVTTGSTLISSETVTIAPEPTMSTSITDPIGDLTFSADPPPPWADLAGATLTRSAQGFELRVRLGGGAVPTTTDSKHTMNIASFYDINGDGKVDYEVWANVADTGWGTSWFDNTAGTGRFNKDSGVTTEVAGDELVLRFPLDHVASASTFRWSIASEWGAYAVIGTDLAARDDAPDNDQPADFPA